MDIDVMTGPGDWATAAELASKVESAGFSGMVWTETTQVPWMQIATAAQAAPSLHFSTGIAVAFPRSPMIAAATAHEIVGNTGGRFRLGLGSQVKAHVERRYGADFDPPAARMRDYVLAVKAAWRAFEREERLAHDGEFWSLDLLPPNWAPAPHGLPMRVDISAVGPVMLRVAGEVADGVHVHPLHSMHYVEHRLLPGVADGAAAAGRDPAEIDLIVPVFACPGDTPEERETYVARTKQQIAFYGSTPNYAYQFDDLGFEGTTDRLRAAMKQGDMAALSDIVTDEMLESFAVVSTWDDIADQLLGRYRGVAARLVTYLGGSEIRHDDRARGRWAEIARAVRAG